MSVARYSALPDRRHPGIPSPVTTVRKALTRRSGESTQLVRQSVQVAFVLLNLWIGVRFWQWVRYYETAGATPWVSRPPGVEGWLPIAALMNLKRFLFTGALPEIHAAGMFLLVAFLAMAFLLRKAFCSWLCPIGTLSEWLWQGGRELFGRTWALPRWADLPLRSLKYVLLGLFLYAVGSMSAGEIRAFLESPYGLIADVKMLDFFRKIGTTAATVIALLIVLSIFVQNVWCRYLCPYGALLGLVSLVSPARIRRNPQLCLDCAQCTKACPSLLPVDQLMAVRSAECTACMLCVSACPAAGALDLGAGRRHRIPGWILGVAVAAIFLLAVGVARASGHWFTVLPDALLFDLIPRAREFGHP